MRYRVTLEEDGAGWFASIPDVPEALTSGQTIDEALTMARDALITAMDFYFEDGRPVPPPGPIGDDDYSVDVPASLWVKVILLNEMLAQKSGRRTWPICWVPSYKMFSVCSIWGILPRLTRWNRHLRRWASSSS